VDFGNDHLYVAGATTVDSFVLRQHSVEWLDGTTDLALAGGGIPPAGSTAQVGVIGDRQLLVTLKTDPDPGTVEETPLHRRHAIAYNNAKVEAERQWQRLQPRGPEVVVLRPAIVFGPRSRWVSACAEELLAGRAYLVDRGRGVCNTIYVDNLLHASRLALTVPEAAGQTFFVGDREPMTWREFYEPIAKALGIDPGTIAALDRAPDFRPGVRDRVRALKSTAAVQFGLRCTPPRLKRSVKAALAGWRNPDSAQASGAAATGPHPTLEMTMLQQCRWQLDWSKAATAIGYEPVVSAAEGMRRSIAWLRFAGYPVR